MPISFRPGAPYLHPMGHAPLRSRGLRARREVHRGLLRVRALPRESHCRGACEGEGHHHPGGDHTAQTAPKAGTGKVVFYVKKTGQVPTDVPSLKVIKDLSFYEITLSHVLESYKTS